MVPHLVAFCLLHGGDAAQPVASVHAPKVVVEEEEITAVEGEEGEVADAADADEEGSKDSES